MRVALLLLLFIPLWCLEIGDPTPNEIGKGFVLNPLASWGQQAREQNSLRILCIGGSNTANLYDGLGYVNLLDKYIKANISNDEHFRTHSYALNRGVSGMSATMFAGRLCDFELNSSFVEWPNVIIVDLAVNVDRTFNALPHALELLVRSVAAKYKVKGFPCPDFMFYNMPHLLQMFSAGLEKKEDREKYVAGYRNLSSAGFESDVWIEKFAEYYHFPVISWGEAMYDAAVRQYLAHNFLRSDTWAYSHDGIHMAPTGGTQFGVDHLLGPFFAGVMKSRKEEEPLKDVSQWPRMFPPSPLLFQMVVYTTYYNAYTFNFLMDALVNRDHSEWKSIMTTHWECLGSTVANSTGELRFDVPVQCHHVACQVKVTFLHSWNSSWIGDTHCILHRHVGTHSGIRLSELTIRGQEDHNGASVPVDSVFSNVNVTAGVHSVKCTNLIEGSMSCMVGLSVNSLLVV